jgi:Tol biopolymer transport system component
MFELVQGAPALSRDTNPAISPDCKWVVFASSRDRPLDETSLWIAKLEPEAVPVRLTRDAIDSHPTWTRDGRAIVFASARPAADDRGFDLYRLPIERGSASGAPERLTSGAGHEVTPAVARDGSIIYAEVTPRPDGQIESHLEQRAPDGTITKLTSGPADSSPALSPDDKTIAFARPKEHPNSVDAELWLLPRGGDTATQIVDVPLTDESGPVWSPDGRFVFATSALRGARGNVLFSSIIHVDLTERTKVARILEDRTGPIARLTPAIGCAALDASALRGDPEYLSEVARIVARAIAEQKLQAEPTP